MIKNLVIIICASFAFTLAANAHCGSCGHDKAGVKSGKDHKCDCEKGKCEGKCHLKKKGHKMKDKAHKKMDKMKHDHNHKHDAHKKMDKMKK